MNPATGVKTSLSARVSSKRPLVQEPELERAQPEHARASAHVEVAVEDALAVRGADARDALPQAAHVVTRRARPYAQGERPPRAGCGAGARRDGRGERERGEEGAGEGGMAHVGLRVVTDGGVGPDILAEK